MKHYGDIRELHGGSVPSADVVIGGSPCQDLSIAGKRAGLQGERSSLFLEQIRLVREMRNATVERADEIRPRFMVWENVPGAFSSHGGEDFRKVLEEIVRIADVGAVIPRPSGGKWTSSGAIVGEGFSVAWRVLDAQFWGVPQRRRRIALVADFGGGSAPEILFERKGLQRGVASGAGAWEGTSAVAESGIGTASGFNYLQGSGARGIGYEEERSETLRAGNTGAAVCYTIDRAAYNQGKNAKYMPRIGDDGIWETLVSRGPGAVCYDVSHADSVIRESTDISPTLQSRMGTGGNQVPLCYSIGNGQADQTGLHEIAGALNCMHDQQAVIYGVPLNFRAEDMRPAKELAATLCNGTSPGTHNGVIEHYRVRRYTPTECERLQGFPDGWTDIGEWTDGKGRKRQTTDGARYKALGNSIALPPWRWVLGRISERYGRRATMASLFDGIGGFPLIWEELNGKGSCLWASETEEFPIAVTKRRFGEE